MNVLKALAKMTKLAAALERNLVTTRHDLGDEKNKRLLAEDLADSRKELADEWKGRAQVAEQKANAEPDPRILSACGKLRELGYEWESGLAAWVCPPKAPELPLPMFAAAVDKLNARGHAWSVPDQRWSDPVPAVPSATPPIGWDVYPWATHLLECGFSQVFAELVDGQYQGAPETDIGHGRLCYHVGLKVQDFKVLAERPGYKGPRTREIAPERDATPGQLPWPKEPAGGRWRNNSIAAAPHSMSELVEVLLLNGQSQSGPGKNFQWGTDVSTGVAWWRFKRGSVSEAGQPE